MKESFTGSTGILIAAPIDEVWDALTNTDTISEWLHGTTVETTWKVNDPIIYRGTWNGQKYKDKGTIIEVEKPHILRSTFLSSFSGLEDKPENYNVVSYELERRGEATKLTVTQSNCKSQEEADSTAKNWESALHSLRDLLEK